MLDSLVRTTALSALDRNDTRASRFAARAVPAITSGVEYPEPQSAVNGGAVSPWDTIPATQSPAPHASPLHTHQPGTLGGVGGGGGVGIGEGRRGCIAIRGGSHDALSRVLLGPGVEGREGFALGFALLSFKLRASLGVKASAHTCRMQ